MDTKQRIDRWLNGDWGTPGRGSEPGRAPRGRKRLPFKFVRLKPTSDSGRIAEHTSTAVLWGRPQASCAGGKFCPARGRLTGAPGHAGTRPKRGTWTLVGRRVLVLCMCERGTLLKKEADDEGLLQTSCSAARTLPVCDGCVQKE